MPAHAALWDGSLAVFDESQLKTFMARPSRVLGASLFEQVNVKSKDGATVHFNYYGLDLTPAQIMDAIRARDVQWVHEKIEDAVVMARDEGCEVVGLGGYTSVVTGNCRRLKVNGIGLTSGNALTLGVGLCVLKTLASEAGIDLATSSVGIVGATGNIGSTYSAMIAPDVREVVLVVRELASPRLSQTIEEVKAGARSTPIRVTDRMRDLANCSLIVCASNSPEPIVFPEHLAQGPVVICDISVPGDVSPEVSRQRPDVTIIEGGIVKLPCNPDFTIAGLALPPGNAYACIAETLLMGLEGERGHGTYGPVTVAGVRRALKLATKHGFQYATHGSSPIL
jgi:predicted amino acid dehydrogenase